MTTAHFMDVKTFSPGHSSEHLSPGWCQDIRLPRTSDPFDIGVDLTGILGGRMAGLTIKVLL